MSIVHDPSIIHIPATIDSCDFFDLSDHVYTQADIKIIIESNVTVAIRDSGTCAIKNIEIVVGIGAQLFWVSDSVHDAITISCFAGSIVYYVQVIGALMVAKSQRLVLSMCQEDSCATVRIFPLLQHNQNFECVTLQQHDASITATDLQVIGHIEDNAQFCHKSKILVKAGLNSLEIEQKTIMFLSAGANVYAQPCFNIASKDVRCTHGAAIGAIDKEQLWYLQARGINTSAARSLIIKSRCMACIDKKLPEYVYESIYSMVVSNQ